MIFTFLLLMFHTLSESSKEKNQDMEEVKLSKNAQFRAIQPSPSTLSFVEDNVICFYKSYLVWQHELIIVFLL